MLQKVSKDIHKANRETSLLFCKEEVILINAQSKKGNKKMQVISAGNPPLSVREMLYILIRELTQRTRDKVGQKVSDGLT